jgi:hypothetical protein
VTGIVGVDGDALADELDDGWIGGNPVSLCFEQPAATSRSAHTANTVNERRIDSPSARGRRRLVRARF